ncbi:hypothetical protein NDN08_003922 [Rhodosorus marinus]|uniref:Putative GTP diphosphokinase RSH1, chloroplastic n=1 Tax=Rhodosorus marinus TaxID=101924 RepID=A0AAV8UGU7_9RHOD|nr:hypothetical protein NDN08_003922 [Rhodosorus marinus]
MCLGNESLLESGAEIAGGSITSMNVKVNGDNGRITASDSAILRYMDDLHPRIGYLRPQCRERILKALTLADIAHEGQLRKSGEPFIIHPVAVAVILAELRLDRDTLVAGLLHDTVEDTPVTLDELESLFGTDVRKIVEGETKFSKLASKVHKSVQTSTQPTVVADQDEKVFGKNVHVLTPMEMGALVGGKKEEEVDKQAEYLRNMFLAMTEDVRVIIVKLADRLHNMRTLQFMKPEKQKKIAAETLDFFAPLAHRLGMRRIKSELEELSFKYLYPEEYEKLRKDVESLYRRSNHEYYLQEAQETLSELLTNDDFLIPKNVSPRVNSLEVIRTMKPLYSIYQKIRRGEALPTMLDLSTLVVVIGVQMDDEDKSKQSAFEKNACYHVLGRIHELWQPLPGRMKDYIAFPKPNGYQSLHTTVLHGPNTRFVPLDIHIRTKSMHKIAEEGIAVDVFSSDPESGGVVSDRNWRQRITLWLRSIREYCHEFSDSSRDLVDAVRYDLLGNRVHIFTPKGRIIDLPKDSTPVDVAYRIHSEVGHRMIGSHVNGRTVGLDHKLQNADLVEIMTDPSAPGPSLDWLDFAKTRTARSKIRKLLREKERGSQMEAGRRILKEAARTRLEPVPSDAGIREILPSIQSTVNGKPLRNVEDLYVALSSFAVIDGGDTELEPVVLDLLRDRRAKVFRDSSESPTWTDNGLQETEAPADLDDEEVVPSLATCCRPVRGDKVKALRSVHSPNSLTIHRAHCSGLDKLEAGGSALVEDFDWNNTDDIDLCPVQAVIEAKDSVGLLAAVSSCITELGKPIVKSASSSYATGYATLAYEFLIEDIDALTLVLESLRGMEGIDSVRRKGDPTTPSVDQAQDVDDKAKALLDDESIWTEEL